ncbi:MAG: Gfo/Idh/MocA family oxidoreductase [bacterium]|nr:Gfo/Idh/MocA family oxidoreductase [bacterium]
MMKTKVQLGVIGCGNIAKNVILPEAAAIDEFHLRGFVDVDAERGAAVCQQFDGDYHTTDLNRLLEDDQIDAALINTLPDTHARLGKTVLEHGKHVFIQKPAAMSIEECRELVEAERLAKGRAMVAYCYRLSPLVKRIREAIPQPQMLYGRMMVADIARTHEKYLKIPALRGGGPMLELACHNVDLVFYLMQAKPVRVFAQGGNLWHPGVDVIDNFIMNIEFENGALATLISGDCGANDFSLKWHTEVFGAGVTAINRGFTNLTLKGKVQDSIDYDYQVGIGLSRDMEVFRDVVLGRCENPTPASQGVVASLLMLKAYESLKTGLPEAIDVSAYL